MLVDLERSEVPWCCDVVTLEAVTILFFFHLWWMSVLTVSWDLWFSFLEILVYVEFFFLFVVFIIVVIIFIITSVGFGLFVTFVFLHSSLPFIERRCLLRPWVTLVTNSLKIDILLLLLYSSVLWYLLFRCCVLPICLSTYLLTKWPTYILIYLFINFFHVYHFFTFCVHSNVFFIYIYI